MRSLAQSVGKDFFLVVEFIDSRSAVWFVVQLVIEFGFATIILTSSCNGSSTDQSEILTGRLPGELIKIGIKMNRIPFAVIVVITWVLFQFTLTGETIAEPQSAKKNDQKKQVAVLIYDGVELLDFTGPAEVFIVANHGKSFRVFTVAATQKEIKTMGNMTIKPEFSIENAPQADVIIVPGGDSRSVKKPVYDWIKKSAPKAEIVMSVCFGAFLLAKCDLLDEIEATTHSWGRADLKKVAPKCQVIDDKRFVVSGKIITTAGVTAGIDGALHVVEMMLGKKAADWTATEWMEYKRIPHTEKAKQ